MQILMKNIMTKNSEIYFWKQEKYDEFIFQKNKKKHKNFF